MQRFIYGFFFVLCSHAWLKAGEIGGSTYDRDNNARLSGVKVSLFNGDPRPISDQHTNNMGAFGFPNLKAGNYEVRGSFPGYAFTTEYVSVAANPKYSIELPGMKQIANNGNDPGRVAGTLIAGAFKFERLETGLAAQWYTFARINLPPSQKALVAQSLSAQLAEARRVPIISSYAFENAITLDRVCVSFTDFYAGKREDLIQDQLPPTITAALTDQARWAIPLSEKRNQEFLKKFDNTWGRDFGEAARAHQQQELTIRRIRYSDWDSTFVAENNQAIGNSLSLRGDVGSYITPNATGKLSNVLYFPFQGRISVQGKWALGDQLGWFEFEFDPENADKFAGEWGRGAKIGAGKALGAWRGNRKKN